MMYQESLSSNPLAIPNPTLVNLEAQAVGDPFVGYRMIAGEPLWRGT